MKRRVGAVIGYTVWLSVAFIGAQFLIVWLAQGMVWLGVPLTSISEAALQTTLAAAAYMLALAVTILVPRYFFKRHTSKKELGLSRLINLRDIAMTFAGIVPYLLLSYLCVSLALVLIPGFKIDQAQDVGFQNLAGQAEYILAFIALVVLAPLAEEVLFRGYLYGKLRRSTNLAVAVLITSLCFAVLHMQLNVGVDVFALSIILCLLREYTGSIWSGVMLHMLKNGVAFYFLFINPMLLQ